MMLGVRPIIFDGEEDFRPRGGELNQFQTNVPPPKCIASQSGMRLEPQAPGSGEWIDSGLAPPFGFIAIAVELTMMPAAQRDGELIADLAAKCTALREAQVVGIAGLAATDQARLMSHMPDVLAIPHPARLRERQGALVD